jgi:DegV family protein with EDD domain
VYEQLAAEGATDILSIHIDSNLSGVLNAARLGAEATNVARVHLFDSKQLTMGLGLLVWVAAEGINAGKTIPQLLELLEQKRNLTNVYAGISTLEFLRRSGRVSWAQFGLGTLLSIKPVLHVHEGIVDLQRIRTQTRAHHYLLDQLQRHAPYSHLAILHTANHIAADNLKHEAMVQLSETSNILIAEVTPAIGSHVGPGGLGFAGITKD